VLSQQGRGRRPCPMRLAKACQDRGHLPPPSPAWSARWPNPRASVPVQSRATCPGTKRTARHVGTSTEVVMATAPRALGSATPAVVVGRQQRASDVTIRVLTSHHLRGALIWCKDVRREVLWWRPGQGPSMACKGSGVQIPSAPPQVRGPIGPRPSRITRFRQQIGAIAVAQADPTARGRCWARPAARRSPRWPAPRVRRRPAAAPARRC
jgi:hypothetical protein